MWAKLTHAGGRPVLCHPTRQSGDTEGRFSSVWEDYPTGRSPEERQWGLTEW